MGASKCKADISKFKGIRVKLYPTDSQKERIIETIRIYHEVYNLALEFQTIAYENGDKYIKYYDMSRIFTKFRNNSSNFAWLNNIQMSTIKQALLALDNAFSMFFDKINNRPIAKTRKRKKSFASRSARTTIHGSQIYIPEIGRVEAMNHHIPKGKLYRTTVTYDGYDFWFSCNIEKEKINMDNIEKTDPVGIDVGIRNMITTSNGEVYHLSDTSKLEKRLKRQQRRLSKDYELYSKIAKETGVPYDEVPKSKNHYKRLAEMHKTQSRITNKRKNDTNVATKRIVQQNPSAIVIEDIRVKDMQKRKPQLLKYAKSTLFYELRRQIEYKAADRDIPVVVADPHYPSSQICSRCGFQHKVYNNKVFICPRCGYREDRDLNAAYNLKKLAQDTVDGKEIVYSIDA